MKRLIIIAALIIAALTMRAQQPTDSVSVMLRHLATTNEYMIRMDKAIKTHNVMVAGGSLLMGAGFIYATRMEKPVVSGYEPTLSQDRMRTGMCIAAAGAAVIAASFIPMPKRVTLDSRGLVVNIDKGKRRK